jgi:hypothetical protein
MNIYMEQEIQEELDDHENLVESDEPPLLCSICKEKINPDAQFAACDNDCGRFYCLACVDLEDYHECGSE